MSQQKLPIEVRLAQTYLDSFNEDPLLDLKGLEQYSEPNFVGKNGRFYLVRCFNCVGTDYESTENYGPAVATGRCAWCGWKPDPEIIAYIYAKMVVSGKVDMHEMRELKEERFPVQILVLPDKRPMTIEEVKEKYPAQYGMAKRGISYQVLDEDDGYPD